MLAHPIDRWSVVVQRAGALLVALAVAGVALFAAMTAVAGPAQFAEIGPANLGAATLQLVLPLVNGWQLADGLVLLLAAVVLVAIGVVGFRRRDVAV